MTPADAFIVLWALVLVGGSYPYFWLAHAQDVGYALIQSGHHPPQRIPLHTTQQYQISGRLGRSVIQTAPGRISFLNSPCRSHYCIHAGWLTHPGEFVACLPNQVSITVYTNTPAQLDAIAY